MQLKIKVRVECSHYRGYWAAVHRLDEGEENIWWTGLRRTCRGVKARASCISHRDLATVSLLRILPSSFEKHVRVSHVGLLSPCGEDTDASGHSPCLRGSHQTRITHLHHQGAEPTGADISSSSSSSSSSGTPTPTPNTITTPASPAPIAGVSGRMHPGSSLVPRRRPQEARCLARHGLGQDGHLHPPH
jgi:hypothetical protein